MSSSDFSNQQQLPTAENVPASEKNTDISKPQKVNVRGVFVDNVTFDEAIQCGTEMVHAGGFHAVYTPNAEIVQLCVEQKEIRALINRAELILPDGAGVLLAAKILKKPLKEKVAGIDFGEKMVEQAAKEGWGIYLLGGKPGVAQKAADKLKEKYPQALFVGTHDGYFQKENEENDAVVEEINNSGAVILFVCLGVPMQEKWIDASRERLPNVRLAMGLGGSLDGYAGNVKRAPKFFVKWNLEWFYRLCKEPRRIGRMLKLPKLVFGTIWYRLFHRKETEA